MHKDSGDFVSTLHTESDLEHEEEAPQRPICAVPERVGVDIGPRRGVIGDLVVLFEGHGVSLYKALFEGNGIVVYTHSVYLHVQFHMVEVHFVEGFTDLR